MQIKLKTFVTYLADVFMNKLTTKFNSLFSRDWFTIMRMCEF